MKRKIVGWLYLQLQLIIWLLLDLLKKLDFKVVFFVYVITGMLFDIL